MRPPPEHAGRLLLAGEARFAVLASTCEQREDHVAVRCAAAPGVPGGNHFRAIALPAGTPPEEWLHERLDEAGEWGWTHCRFELDDRTFPANLGDVLGAADFLPKVFGGCVARTDDVAAPRNFMLVRAVAAGDAQDTTLVESLLASQHRETRVPLALAEGKLTHARARLTHPEVTVLLAQVDERPAGLIAYLDGDELAFVRKLYVAEHARSQGVATAMLRAVAERAAAPLIGLFAPTAGRLPEFYRARGFSAVTRRETWTRTADVLDVPPPE